MSRSVRPSRPAADLEDDADPPLPADRQRPRHARRVPAHPVLPPPLRVPPRPRPRRSSRRAHRQASRRPSAGRDRRLRPRQQQLSCASSSSLPSSPLSLLSRLTLPLRSPSRTLHDHAASCSSRTARWTLTRRSCTSSRTRQCATTCSTSRTGSGTGASLSPSPSLPPRAFADSSVDALQVHLHERAGAGGGARGGAVGRRQGVVRGAAHAHEGRARQAHRRLPLVRRRARRDLRRDEVRRSPSPSPSRGRGSPSSTAADALFPARSTSINDMKDMLASLPQMREVKEKVRLAL